MSNTINWGKIYEKTAWGIGVVTNTISWGKIYANLAGSIPSFALDFANIANDFTFTRSSFATRVNEFGLIETVTDLGSDLVTNGTFDTDLSGWSIQGGNTNWVWDNGTATMNGGVESGLTQAIGDNTTLYQVTIEVVALNGSSLRVLDASSGNVFLSEGINTIQTTLLGGVLYIKPSAIVGDIVIDNVSVKEVLEDDVPRIDYSTGEPAFLLEPQSTNLLPYSEDFSQWDLQSNTLNLISGVAPDGSASVYELTSVTSGKLQRVVSSLAINTTYTFSFYVKQTSPTTSVQSRVLSQTGGSGGSNLIEVTYQDQLVTDEWVRITHTFTTNDTLGNYIVYVSNALTVGESLQFWGAQVEEGSYATSYIPTNGSSVTRSAETCVDATPTINSEEGVIYFEGSTLVNGIQNRYISISDGTTNNRLQVIFSSASNRLTVGGKKGGVSFSNIDYNSYTQTDNNKFAIVYSSSGTKLFVNGVDRGEIVADASYPEGTLTDFDFSLWDSSTAPFYGNTKDLKIYDKALTDDELITLTTI